MKTHMVPKKTCVEVRANTRGVVERSKLEDDSLDSNESCRTV